MMKLTEYRKLAQDHNPCAEGIGDLKGCFSRKRAFELALHPSYYDFFVRSVEKGWGPSVDEVTEFFSSYINGRLSAEQGGSEAQMWCGDEPCLLDEDVRTLILIGYTGTVTLTDWCAVKIVAGPGTDAVVIGGLGSFVALEKIGGGVRTEDCVVREINRK